jgi:hypothetical protein
MKVRKQIMLEAARAGIDAQYMARVISRLG